MLVINLVSRVSGRWILVTFSFPSRSKLQRAAARGFSASLARFGYTSLHKNASVRFVHHGIDTKTEYQRLANAMPTIGTLFVAEITTAGFSRSLYQVDGEASCVPNVPEAFLVFADPEFLQQDQVHEAG